MKWNQLAEEASSVVGSQDSTDNIETHEEESSNHIYESVDQSDSKYACTSNSPYLVVMMHFQLAK